MELCCGFLTRIFCVDEIRSVRVDFRSGTAAVHYRGGIRPAALLHAMADKLRCRESPPMHERLRHLFPPRGEAPVTIYHHGPSLSSWDVAASRCHWFLRGFTVEFDAPEAREWPPGPLGRTTLQSLARRTINLSMAGVSFSLAVLGVATPGIPTVPFLLATSYFLLRSSPRLNERLLRSPLFGSLLRDWQQHRGMRRRVKVISLAVMAVVVILIVLTAGLSPAMLVVVLLLTALGAAMILRTPTIGEGASQPGALTAPA